MPDVVFRLKVRSENASPGPWFASPNYLIGGWWVQTEESRKHEGSIADLMREEDAQFIAEAKTDLPELLREFDRLKGIITEYGRHNEGCSAAHGDQYRCRCGWREVEQEFKE